MKNSIKTLVLISILFSTVFAGIRLQGQASTLGTGYGLGLGLNVVPLIMDIGIEGATYQMPTFSSKGSYTDEGTGANIPYDGNVGLKSTRAGAFVALHLPVANLLPFVGFLFNPVLHFGTQHVEMSVDGSVRLLNGGSAIGESLVGEGSYFLVGFPTYLGPFFIEPALGTQHIFVADYCNYKNTPEAQLAIGLSF